MGLSLVRPIVRDAQTGFRGGLNLVADASQLGGDEMRVAVNARLTDDGGTARRRGTQRLLAAPLGVGDSLRGGFAWTNASGAQRLLAVSGGLLYDGLYATPATLAAQVGALSTSALPYFAAFRTPSATAMCYIADGGLLNKYDGTTLTVDIASTPATSVVAVYNSRLFGISGDNETLYWSALDNGDTLGIVASGGGFAAVRTFGRQRLGGLLALGGSLLLFHERGISRFTGVSIDDISILAGTRGVSQDVGTIAPHSIVAVENTGFFVSDRGVYRVTEEGVEPISTKVDPIISALAATDLRAVRAVHSRATREVWFYLPGYGTYIYNYRTQGWAGPWNGGYLSPSPLCLFEAVDSDGKSIVLMGSADGQLRHCDFPDIYLDDVASDGTGGDGYTLQIQCHRMFSGDMATEKSLRWGFLLADLGDSSTCSVQWRTQSESGSYQLPASTAAAWGTGLWGTITFGSEGATTFEIPMSGRGTWVEITLVDDGVARALFSRFETDSFNMGRGR